MSTKSGQAHQPGNEESEGKIAANDLPCTTLSGTIAPMRLLLENLPPSLAPQRETLARCLNAMNGALPLRAVYLFGSHARGEARPDSDVDLCLVAEGAERQLAAA